MNRNQSTLWMKMVDRTRTLVTYARGRLTSDIYLRIQNYEDAGGQMLFHEGALTNFGAQMIVGELQIFSLYLNVLRHTFI